jgi:predicted MPP superfamily phosphohydrolase
MTLYKTKTFSILTIVLLVLQISCTKKEQVDIAEQVTSDEINSFSFVQLCDTQIGFGVYDHDLKRFAQAAQQINLLNVDFVVLCGDLVHRANDSSYADFNITLDKIQKPTYVAPGNHDVGNIPNKNSLNFYRKHMGKDYYNFEHKNYSFIITNSQLWKANIPKESRKHDNWFKKTLLNSKSKKQPVFVIGHYPLFIETPTELEYRYNFPLEKRIDILNLFEKNDVVAYLSGHTHELVKNEYNNIQLVSGETTSINFDQRPSGFRVWSVSSDKIENQFIPLKVVP